MTRQKRPGRSRRALGTDEAWRTCVGTRARGRRDDLLRFVRAPDGAVAFDVASAMPHRGAWTEPTERAIRLAVERGGFERAFSAPVLAEPDALATSVGQTLEEEALRGLGLLRRAGALALGQDEVARGAAAGELSAVVTAGDLAPRSQAVAKNTGLPVVVGPPMAMIGAALGRSPTGLVGIRGRGPLAQRTTNHLSRLARLRGRAVSREPETQEARP